MRHITTDTKADWMGSIYPDKNDEPLKCSLLSYGPPPWHPVIDLFTEDHVWKQSQQLNGDVFT